MEADEKHHLLQKLPGIDQILELAAHDHYLRGIPKPVLTRATRSVVQKLRSRILEEDQNIKDTHTTESKIITAVNNMVTSQLAPKLVSVVNATGVVIHTNLGRSILCADALKNITTVAGGYSNLEFDLSTGTRGSRYAAVEDIICEISGAEGALVVNNNAGAVLLCLETLAHGKKVVVSRGELVEIGGSFRIPDVMTKSGGVLVEVGTTNRTHLEDYKNAIDDNTALLLKVHKSNYSITGFTAEVPLKALVHLAKTYAVPVMEDLGSGTFVNLSAYGLMAEPRVQDSVAAGIDLVTFSGDKLLGGPQAGVIVGKKHLIEKIKKNPITRALRIDKLTLAALESTLRLYRDEKQAIRDIPTLGMLTLPFETIIQRAEEMNNRLAKLNKSRLATVKIKKSSRVGGGAVPAQTLPSICIGVRVSGMTVNTLEQFMRNNSPPIIGRIEEDYFMMDVRTIQKDEFPIIQSAFSNLLAGGER